MATEWLPLVRNSLALMLTFGGSAASGALNTPPFWRRAASRLRSNAMAAPAAHRKRTPGAPGAATNGIASSSATRPNASLGVAVFATFTASALLHAWLLLAAGGYVLALSIASFFVIQGALVLVEQRARVRRWPVWLQRAWTGLAILLPLPLLLEPLIALVLP
jgi:hypothetical protein